MDTKTCTKCGITKDLGCFHKDPRQKHGVRPDCKECKRKRNKKGYEENKKARMEYKKKQIARYRQDSQFRLRESVSQHVRSAIRGARSATFDALPYTPQQLCEHLEAQFDENMNWDNYGSYWNIDHIYPQSKLLYDSYEHPNFLKCWDLSNLRPLEAIENIRKGNKVI